MGKKANKEIEALEENEMRNKADSNISKHMLVDFARGTTTHGASEIRTAVGTQIFVESKCEIEMEDKKGVEMPKKYDDGPIKSMIMDFASTTTAHGVGRIASATKVTAKLAWFFIWLCVMVGFFLMLVKLLLLYKSKPVSTKISMTYENSLAFPGVTICNLNILRKSMSAEIIGKKPLTSDEKFEKGSIYKDSFKDGSTAIDASSLSVDDTQTELEDKLTEINILPEDNRTTKGYQFESFIVYCNWAGLLCHQGFFKDNYWRKMWNWKYGNCFTFNGYTSQNNTDISVLKSTQSGSSAGLQLIFDIGRSEYITSLTAEAGVRVLIADQDLMLHPEESGISLSAGTSVSISLRMHVIEREDVYQNGSCLETSRNEDSKYSLEHCFEVCRMKTEKNTCNCSSFQYAALPGTVTCDTVKQDQCLYAVARDFGKGKYDCSCPVPCREIIFDKTVTKGDIYPEGFLNIYGMQKRTADYVESNMIKLSIYYDNHIVQKIETKAYYKFDNLISDIGGQLGLWIGVSAVTCVEFFSLVWSLMVFIISKKKKTRIRSNEQ